ncbi:MAG TPA: hypothetical protein VM802_17545 [Chitinophaga sp.]|uniref:hypothetical protein n=1 Tax=Chitinophaga sp. TaxID=1869181 RepID=UPI002CE2FDB4|nr:hypothetical protein [Chitinophaga sp.]HVI46687.1 hypothetical protein [Chitinophaga sp.]
MIIETIAALKKISIPDTSTIYHVLGYHQKGDGGGGIFFWDTTNINPIDEGTVIGNDIITTGVWKRLYNGPVDVLWFGIQPNSNVDTYPLLQHIFEKFNDVYLGPGKYLISNTLVIKKNYGSVTGRNATLCPSKSMTAIELHGQVLHFSGINISFEMVRNEDVDENAVGIWLHKSGTSNNDQVNNSFIGQFAIQMAHTGIKSTPNTGLLWQLKLSQIFITVYPGKSTQKAIGIDLESVIGSSHSGSFDGGGSTTVTLEKISVQQFNDRPKGIGFRGYRIWNTDEVVINDCSFDYASINEDGQVLKTFARYVKIDGLHCEDLINTMDVNIAGEVPIRINQISCAEVDKIVLLRCKVNVKGSIGAWVSFASSFVKMGAFIYDTAIPTDDLSTTKLIDFSLYRGHFQSTGNLQPSHFSYYERNAVNTFLQSDASWIHKTDITQNNEPVTIFGEHIPFSTYLIMVRARYSTDSGIAFSEILHINTTAADIPKVVVLNTNNISYPFTISYTVGKDGINAAKSGGSSLIIETKRIFLM